jgi:hypothetical protein
VHKAVWGNNIDIERIATYFDTILCSTFKDNKYLEKVLMTGISGISRAFSDLNNVSEYKFLVQSEFSEFFGFTEDEVLQLLNDFGLYGEKDSIKSWYDGYHVKNGGNMAIYNPWSIVKFLQLSVYESYWTINGAFNNVMEIFRSDNLRYTIIKLINNELVKFKIVKQIYIDDIKILQN